MVTAWERIQGLVNDDAAAPVVARTIGFHVTSAEVGSVVVELDADVERHGNFMGSLHGGVLCDVADAAMGLSYASTLPVGETFTTLELKINFLRPVWKAHLRAVGRVIQRGKTIGVTECEILDEQDRLIAKASSTCMTLRGDQARGR